MPFDPILKRTEGTLRDRKTHQTFKVCITIIVTIILYTVTNYTNDAYTYDT
jgi:hypothetical protein